MLLQSTRTASLVGSALGVMVGCLIGMFPLLFLPDSDVMEAVKRKEKVTYCIILLLHVLLLRVAGSHFGQKWPFQGYLHRLAIFSYP